MNGLPYYKAYPRDFIEGTVGMPFELKGAYRLILDLIYMQGGNLPDDARYISGLLGCSVRAWNKWRFALLEMGKIRAENGIISNFRADKEIETSRTLQDKMSKNANAPRKNNKLPKAIAKPKLSHTESDTEEEKRKTKVFLKKKPEKKLDLVLSQPSPEAKKSRMGTRLSADWRLPRGWGEWAVAEGWSATAVRLEADKFRDYWVSKSGKDATKLDWQATWRNWMRNSKSPKSNGGGYGETTDRRSDPVLANIARLVGLDAAEGNAGDGIGGHGEESGSLRVGSGTWLGGA